MSNEESMSKRTRIHQYTVGTVIIPSSAGGGSGGEGTGADSVTACYMCSAAKTTAGDKAKWVVKMFLPNDALYVNGKTVNVSIQGGAAGAGGWCDCPLRGFLYCHVIKQVNGYSGFITANGAALGNTDLYQFAVAFIPADGGLDSGGTVTNYAFGSVHLVIPEDNSAFAIDLATQQVKNPKLFIGGKVLTTLPSEFDISEYTGTLGVKCELEDGEVTLSYSEVGSPTDTVTYYPLYELNAGKVVHDLRNIPTVQMSKFKQ